MFQWGTPTMEYGHPWGNLYSHPSQEETIMFWDQVEMTYSNNSKVTQVKFLLAPRH